jgi:hypothetical protein
VRHLRDRSITSSSIGHPPLSLASPVKLRLWVGPSALSGKKRFREQGVNNFLCPSVRQSVRNAPKENTLGVNKQGIMYRVRYFLVHTNSDNAKREKVCHLRIGIYIWNYYDLTKEKVSTGMVDEKVTVISSFLTWLFFCH